MDERVDERVLSMGDEGDGGVVMDILELMSVWCESGGVVEGERELERVGREYLIFIRVRS